MNEGKAPKGKEKLRRFVDVWLTNGQDGTAAVQAVGYKGTRASLGVTASRLLKKARESGLVANRLQRATRAMGADEIIDRLSDMGRGEGQAVGGLLRIARKTDMGRFTKVLIRAVPGPEKPKEGEKPSLMLEEDVVLDLPSAHANGLMRYVKELKPTQFGTAIKLESRADALKAAGALQKGALESLAKIRGLGEQTPQAGPSVAALASLLALIPPSVLAQMHKAEAKRLQGAPTDQEEA